jgi:sugar lactone lactonase YvrE
MVQLLQQGSSVMTRPFLVLDASFHQVVPHDARLERIAASFRFTEGPVWRGDHLLFTDIPRSRIVRWQELPEGPQVTTFRVEYDGALAAPVIGHCNGMTLDREGRLS